MIKLKVLSDIISGQTQKQNRHGLPKLFLVETQLWFDDFSEGNITVRSLVCRKWIGHIRWI